MALTISDVEKAFVYKLGAQKDTSGDHIHFYLNYHGSEYTVGKLSRSWKGSLNNSQIGMLARKLYLQKREFEQWVNCTVTNTEMTDLWQERHCSLA